MLHQPTSKFPCADQQQHCAEQGCFMQYDTAAGQHVYLYRSYQASFIRLANGVSSLQAQQHAKVWSSAIVAIAEFHTHNLYHIAVLPQGPKHVCRPQMHAVIQMTAERHTHSQYHVALIQGWTRNCRYNSGPRRFLHCSHSWATYTRLASCCCPMTAGATSSQDLNSSH